MKNYKSIFILLFGVLFTNILLAQDVEPPDWRTNGLPGLTFQIWEFEMDINPAPPTYQSNVYGSSSCDVYSGEFTNNLPNPDSGNPTPVSGWYFPTEDNALVLTVPNDPAERDSKIIRIQITSSKAPADTSVGTTPPATLISNTYNMSWQHSTAPWYTYVKDYLIQPNPDSETIAINFPANTIVEEVVIDTWCLPEANVIFLVYLICYFLRRK